jgi:hypothetical protein
MTVSQLYEWRLRTPSRCAHGEAATSWAIKQRSASLSLGPYRFLYKDDELPHGGHLLTLSALEATGEEDVLQGCVAQQHVPPRLSGRDSRSHDELVNTLGAALFHDVALLAASAAGRRLCGARMSQPRPERASSGDMPANNDRERSRERRWARA